MKLLEEKRRNDKADKLAVRAAEDAELAKKLTAVSKQERKLVRDIQRTMVDIAMERYRALKAMKEEGSGIWLPNKADQGKNGEEQKGAEEEAEEVEEEEEFWRRSQFDEEQNEDIWGDIDIDGNEVECNKPPQVNGGGSTRAKETKQNPEDEKPTPEDKKEAQGAGEAEHPLMRNPALAEGRRDFPQYQWDEQGGEAAIWFTGVREPKRLETQGKGRRNTVWKYDNALYPALMWYWSNISWESGQDGEISWAEVALDFQATTHTGLAREGQEANEETLRTRAKMMAACSRRIACLCREDITPGGKKQSGHGSVLCKG